LIPTGIRIYDQMRFNDGGDDINRMRYGYCAYTYRSYRVQRKLTGILQRKPLRTKLEKCSTELSCNTSKKEPDVFLSLLIRISTDRISSVQSKRATGTTQAFREMLSQVDVLMFFGCSCRFRFRKQYSMVHVVSSTGEARQLSRGD
jgi:hypothetical protein